MKHSNPEFQTNGSHQYVESLALRTHSITLLLTNLCTFDHLHRRNGQFLDLDKELAQGFFPMTERGLREIPQLRRLTAAESWEQRVEAFRTGLPPAGEKRLVVLRDLMVIVALQCGYDARTR